MLEYHDSFFLSLLYKHELCMFDFKTSSYTSWFKKNIESYWKCVCIWMNVKQKEVLWFIAKARCENGASLFHYVCQGWERLFA